MSDATDLLDAILESLSHLICSEREKANDVAKVHFLQARDFDGYEPLIRNNRDEQFNDDLGISVGDNPCDQPVWPVDISLAMTAVTGEDGWPEGSWQFDRFQTLRPKEWRGKIHKVFPRMIDRRFMVARPDGTHVSARIPYALVGRKAMEVPRANTGMRLNAWGDFNFGVSPSYWGTSSKEVIDHPDVFALRMIGGFALRRRYHWSVLLGEGDNPRARFVTDPEGLREVFRFRDIPPGRARRTALLHWVKAHWRKRRDPSANDRAWVRQYIRGAWSYQWNGLRCQIEPAEYDLEQVMGDLD